MHRGQGIEQLGVDDLQTGLEQLGANQERQNTADDEHREAEEQIQGADVLVVGRIDPTTPPCGRVLVVIVMGVIMVA
jgi:hypothetical protein